MLLDWPDKVLNGAFRPCHDENRMHSEGDVESARKHYLEQRPSNLHYLLYSRYEWMNDYLRPKMKAVELGSAPGLARKFIHLESFQLTDVQPYPWIDDTVDALKLPYAPNSVDAFILSHMLHHVARPIVFLAQVSQCLVPGGVVLIQDINTSLVMRLLLWLNRHEGWDQNVDVFDPHVATNDPADPWSANCAVPRLLFADPKRFDSALPSLEVVRNEVCECLLFPLSGGVIAKRKTINLPMWMLRGIDHVDRLLTTLSPRVFALGRRVVLRKR
jgi:SAM-dependent methyltransferase